MEAGDRPPRPGRRARAPGGGSRRRARPPALRPHARLRVHLLPRRRGDHGRRPRGDAELRALGSGVRRRSPLELRRLRVAGPQPGRRHQRLRRDPPRPMGMGRQAARRQLRDRGPGPRVHRQAATRGRARRDAGLSREHASPRRAQQSRRLVPARQRRPDPRSVCTSGAARRSGAGSSATSPRPSARTGCGRCRS